jgi:hypothetical protein
VVKVVCRDRPGVEQDRAEARIDDRLALASDRRAI